MSKFKLKPIAAVVGTALAASISAASADVASDGLFAAEDLNSGYNVLSQKDGEGKCGEGKCGEGKCGEGKCGEGKCGEGKCGEGKCGEGKCGEGKCGGAS